MTAQLLDINSLNGKRVLVTGGCGFMGSDFIRFILSQIPDVKVTNVDALTYAANPKNLSGVDASRYTFVQGNITDAELMVRLMKDADFVVNFAAETHVDRSIHADARSFFTTNVIGVHTLLEVLRTSPNVQRMIHISTDEVWGDIPLESSKRFTEESPLLPNSPYAASKAAGDLIARAYVRTHNLPVIVTHSVNNFGPGQFSEKLIPFFTLRALEGKPLPLYGNGKQMRDWLYVEDHSWAILTLLKKGILGEVYSISQQKEYENIYIAEKILDILGKPRSLITFVEDRPAHDAKYAVDSAKLRFLGWLPRYPLETKLSEVVKEIAGQGRTLSEDINVHIKV